MKDRIFALTLNHLSMMSLSILRTRLFDPFCLEGRNRFGQAVALEKLQAMEKVYWYLFRLQSTSCRGEDA